MGKVFNHPTPTVINTELVPLDESFFIAADGQTEQWYYDNEAKYAPNRHLTPLTLTPKLSVKDKDTNISYGVDAGTASFYTVTWYALEYTNGGYVETAITNLTDSSDADYVLSGFNLIVKKNVSYSHGVTIRCLATYKDPRDLNTTCTTQGTVLLTTNRDANVELPEVTIISPSARAFNPLTDYKTVNGVEVQDSLFDFEATVSNKPTGDSVIQYRVDGGGTEELVEEDGVMTALPSMDIRYPDSDVMLDQSFLYRITANGTKPNVSGMAFLTTLRGNTVKFNQLCTNGDFHSATESFTLRAGGTLTVEDNVGTLTRASTGSVGSCIQLASLAVDTTHRYYQCVTVKSNDGISVALGFHTNAASPTVSGNATVGSTSTDFTTISQIASPVSDSHRLAVRLGVAGTGTGVTCNVKNLMLIDLTTLFGTDAQIASALGITTADITTATGVAAFETWLAQNLGQRDYYAYNAGSLVPTSINAMKSCGNSVTWNQMIDNGGFEENRMTWRGRSTDSVLLSIENGMLSYKRTGTYYTLSQVLITPVPGGHKVYASLDTDYTGTLYASFIYNTNEGYGTPTSFSSGAHKRVILTVPSNKIRFAIHPLSMAVNDVIHLDNIKLIDLTLLFGEGNEPTTTAEFEEWMTMNELTEDYYPYIAGEEIYSKGRYKTLGSIVLDTVPIPVTQIKGKLNGEGESVTVFPDGMKRVGNVYDEIKVEGEVLKAIKRVGSVDLGTLNWSRYPSRDWFRSSSTPSNMKKPSSNFSVLNGICSKYFVRTSSQTESTDKSIGVPGNSSTIYIKDDSFDYDSPSVFKEAMSGEYLFFEFATPQEYILDPIQSPFVFEWFGISGNQEVKADTLPWYVSGQGTSRLTVDAMFGEHINVVAAAKTISGQISPSRAYAAVTWRIPDVDTHVMSAKGGTVRNESDSFTFETICNVKGQMLSENVKNEHLRFNWKWRKSDSTTENDAGWGQSVILPSANLINVRTVAGKLPSTHVYPYPFLLGAWTPISGILPEGYTELEYIESSGTQYLDSGLYCGSNNVEIQGKFESVVSSPEKDILSNQDNSTNRFVLGVYSNVYFAYSRNSSGNDTNATASCDGVAEVRVVYDKTNLKKSITVNGVTDTKTYNRTIANSDRQIKVLCGYAASDNTASLFYSGKVYYIRYLEDGVLKMALVPAKRDSDGEIGMYDVARNTFLTNAGTGTFGYAKRLPYGYTELEYLESSGTQYIDTGINPQVAPNAIADLMLLNTLDRDYWGNSLVGSASYIVDISNYVLQYYRYATNTAVNVGTIGGGVRHTVEVGKKVYVDGTLKYTSPNTYVPAASVLSIKLFGSNRSTNRATFRLYSFKLYDGDNLVRDLIPAMRNSDRTVGMYDLVSDTLLTNAGTGTFLYEIKPTSEQPTLVKDGVIYTRTIN